MTEIFSYGTYGGFGSLTRTIAKGLTERGHDVYVVTPRFPDQPPVDMIDGFKVLSHFRGAWHTARSQYIYHNIEADVYHSEEPNIGSYLAEKARPEAKHLITFQDPRVIADHRREWDHLNIKQRQRMEWIMKGMYHITRKAVKRADMLTIQAWYAKEKARKIYRLGNQELPQLPNPVEITKQRVKKADKPTVCFLARWDPRKRVEYFLKMARKFPDVHFICLGKTQPHFDDLDARIRFQYSGIPNLEMPGFVSEEKKRAILEKSWIMINTSWRECLPVAYLEAAAYKCAILSHENPDNFASEFGLHVESGHFYDFCEGLETLLEHDRWRERGRAAYWYVKKHHEYQKVIKQHEDLYKKLLVVR